VPHNPLELARLGMQALCCMVCRLGVHFVPFVGPAHDQVICCKTSTSIAVVHAYDHYRGLISRVLRGASSAHLQEPCIPELEHLLAIEPEEEEVETGSLHGLQQQQQLQQLAAAAAAAAAATATTGATAASTTAAGKGFFAVAGMLPPPPLQTPVQSGAGGTTLGINHAMLFAAFNTAGCTKAGDWTEWSRRVGVELLRQSPSILLRPCASLAQVSECCHVSARL
jgi:hypothetical protein